MDNLTQYTDAVSKVGSTASGILGALNGSGKSTPAPVAAAPAPAKTNWLLIGGIGGAVLLILGLFVLGSKK